MDNVSMSLYAPTPMLSSNTIEAKQRKNGQLRANSFKKTCQIILVANNHYNNGDRIPMHMNFSMNNFPCKLDTPS